MAARAFDAAEDFYRTSARINALASRWLDAKGRPLPTPILPNPDAYPDLDEPYLVAPSVAARHDPQAAAEGARLLRGYLTRSHDTWVYLDRERAAPTLARLDAWAEGR